MKIAKSLLALLVSALFFAGLTVAQEHKTLTNKDVVDMVKQGLNETMIIKVIQASDTEFDTSPDAMTQLQSGGVSLNIMDAMLKADQSKKNAAAAPVSATSTAPAGSAPAAASSATSAPAPAPAPADANPGKHLLKEGTEVPLKFAQDLSSKTANEGDAVELTLDNELKVGDVVVAKPGAKAVAVVSNAKKAGMVGKGGELNIQLQHLTVNGVRVRVRGTKGREGESKTGTAVALTVLFGPIGLLKHGKNVEVKAGTPLVAFVDEDTWLPPAI